jgi:O-antigen/teichoic acid export membrane protein
MQPLVAARTERSIHERFASGIGWNSLFMISTQGSTFAVNILLANLLGRQVFGEFAIVLNTLVTLAGIGQMATGITAAKFVAESRISNKRVAGEILGLCSVLTFVTGLIGSGLLIALSPWISGAILSAPKLKGALVISAAASLFLTMNAFQVGALSGLEAFRSSALVSCVMGFAHVAVSGIGGWLFGLDGVLWALVISAILRWAVFAQLLKFEAKAQGIKVSLAGWLSQKWVLHSFTIPAAVCGMSSMPSLWAANALLARQKGGLGLLALYSAAFQLKAIVILLPSMFNNVGLPILSHQRGIGNVAGYRRAFWLNVSIAGGAATLAAIVVAAMGRPLLRMYGTAFEGAYDVLLILLCAAVVEGIAIGAFQALQSKGRMWLAFLSIALPSDVLTVVLAYVLVGAYGLMGLAWAYSIALIVRSLLTFVYAYLVGLDLSHAHHGAQGGL